MNMYGEVALRALVVWTACITSADAGLRFGNFDVGNQKRQVDFAKARDARTLVLLPMSSSGDENAELNLDEISDQLEDKVVGLATVPGSIGIGEDDADEVQDQLEDQIAGSANLAGSIRIGEDDSEFHLDEVSDQLEDQLEDQIAGLVNLAGNIRIGEDDAGEASDQLEDQIVGSVHLKDDAEDLHEVFSQLEDVVVDSADLAVSISVMDQSRFSGGLRTKPISMTSRNIVSHSRNILSRREAEKIILFPKDMIGNDDAEQVIQHYLGRPLSDIEAGTAVDEIMSLLGTMDMRKQQSRSEEVMSKTAARNIVSRNILSQREAEKLISNSRNMISDDEAEMVIKSYFGRALSESEARKTINEIMKLISENDALKQLENEELRDKVAARSIVSRSQNILSRRDAQKLIVDSGNTISDDEAQMVIKRYFGRTLSDSEASRIVDEIMKLLGNIDSQKQIEMMRPKIDAHRLGHSDSYSLKEAPEVVAV